MVWSTARLLTACIIVLRTLSPHYVFLLTADNNRPNAIDVLIDAGANIESQDVHQWTPLHCAARWGVRTLFPQGSTECRFCKHIQRIACCSIQNHQCRTANALGFDGAKKKVSTNVLGLSSLSERLLRRDTGEPVHAAAIACTAKSKHVLHRGALHSNG